MKILLIVMDSLGIGGAPDALEYQDALSNNTYLSAKSAAPAGDFAPHLKALGLEDLACKDFSQQREAFRAILQEISKGKDTITGHWEMAGVVSETPYPTYPNGFPKEVVQCLEKIFGSPILGNEVASGTEIIQRLGQEHLETSYPIVYTSADSVLQIAAHEDKIPLDQLYQWCYAIRQALVPPHNVARIIARPFITGEDGRFIRTANRHDYALETPEPNLLSQLAEHHIPSYSIGKIGDIFHSCFFTERLKTVSNLDGIKKTIEKSKAVQEGLIFTNLVDFDMLYGHRRDAQGYAQAIAELDAYIPQLQETLGEEDWLFLTADHGCDPKATGTDHTRELVPFIGWSPQLKGKPSLYRGQFKSFAHVGATLLHLFGVEAKFNCESILMNKKEEER